MNISSSGANKKNKPTPKKQRPTWVFAERQPIVPARVPPAPGETKALPWICQSRLHHRGGRRRRFLLLQPWAHQPRRVEVRIGARGKTVHSRLTAGSSQFHVGLGEGRLKHGNKFPLGKRMNESEFPIDVVKGITRPESCAIYFKVPKRTPLPVNQRFVNAHFPVVQTHPHMVDGRNPSPL